MFDGRLAVTIVVFCVDSCQDALCSRSGRDVNCLAFGKAVYFISRSAAQTLAKSSFSARPTAAIWAGAPIQTRPW